VASHPPPTDDGLSVFETARPRLFGIVYRMLSSVAEAEDVMQGAWTRWQSTNRGGVRHPQAFLITTATRLAINVLQSARPRRDPARMVTSLGSVAMFLVLCFSLSWLGVFSPFCFQGLESTAKGGSLLSCCYRFQ